MCFRYYVLANYHLRENIIYFYSLTEDEYSTARGAVEELYDDVNFKFSSFLLKLKWRMIEGAREEILGWVQVVLKVMNYVFRCVFPKKEQEGRVQRWVLRKQQARCVCHYSRDYLPSYVIVWPGKRICIRANINT